MVQGNSSIDPRRYASEVFDLLSIPAFDAGEPEVTSGSNIGSSKQLVQPNDILISKIVPHIRRAWVVSANRGRRQIASGEWIVFRSEKVFPGYLRHALVSDGFHSQFMQTVSGVGGSLLRARPSHVGKIELPLPPLPEQRRIAEVLDRAETLRALRRQALAQLDALAEAIFVDMFGDPVSNSNGWDVARIDELCSLVRGSSPRPQGDPRFFGGPVPRLMVADITRDGWLVTPRIDSLTIEGSKLSRPVPRGTVVMAVSGNVGLVSRLAIDACVHDGFVAFKGLDEQRCDPGYLLAVLHFMKSTHEQSKAGAIFINLTTTDIKAMRIPLPPRSLQEEFVCRLAQRDRIRATMNVAREQADALFASLQHRAFRGAL
jgi:type I restriction enzyme, S subunit